jgi:hypothetical protein
LHVLSLSLSFWLLSVSQWNHTVLSLLKQLVYST